MFVDGIPILFSSILVILAIKYINAVDSSVASNQIQIIRIRSVACYN